MTTSNDVCGAVVNIRVKGHKISIWATKYENREAAQHVGRRYKERLGFPPKSDYQSHANIVTKNGSTINNRFVA